MPCIYKFDFPNGKCYIGQTIQEVTARWNQHRKNHLNPNDRSYECLFYRALRKYTYAVVSRSVICECCEEELNSLETSYIKQYNSLVPNGYNSTTGGDLHMQMSEHSKQKMSEKALERFKNKDAIKKISDAAIERFKDDDEKLRHSIRMKARDSKTLRRDPEMVDMPKYVRRMKKSSEYYYIIANHPKCKYKSFIVHPDASKSKCLEYMNRLNLVTEIKQDLSSLSDKLQSSIERNKRIQNQLLELNNILMDAVQRLNGNWGDTCECLS